MTKKAGESSTGQSAKKKTITLVGLMGAGKTTVGRRLAKRLKRPFYDADEEIEKAAGRSVTDIFAEYGEAHFRDGERKVIERLLEGEPCILATGGGAFMNAETRSLIREKAISVWLRVELDVLVERVSRRNTRPLLINNDPAEVLARLAKEREPAYEEADLVVDSGEGTHDKSVSAIVTALKSAGYSSQ